MHRKTTTVKTAAALRLSWSLRNLYLNGTQTWTICILSQQSAVPCCCWSCCPLLDISPDHLISRTFQSLNNQARQQYIIWLQVPLVCVYGDPFRTSGSFELFFTICIPGHCHHCRGCHRSNLQGRKDETRTAPEQPMRSGTLPIRAVQGRGNLVRYQVMKIKMLRTCRLYISFAHASTSC